MEIALINHPEEPSGGGAGEAAAAPVAGALANVIFDATGAGTTSGNLDRERGKSGDRLSCSLELLLPRDHVEWSSSRSSRQCAEFQFFPRTRRKIPAPFFHSAQPAPVTLQPELQFLQLSQFLNDQQLTTVRHAVSFAICSPTLAPAKWPCACLSQFS